ncbi:MAG TPA: hypothetical protein P5246_04280 [Candidatus Omnitrophota bacterium]|nr:hypothetical protein [Candidatus Omnitrophota bacterium]
MSSKQDIVIAAKCAPQEGVLADIEKAGLEAVELYLSEGILKDVCAVIETCRKFSLRYALHAPTDGLSLEGLKALAAAVNAEVIVFHDIYWDDEWPRIIESLSGLKATICIENTPGVHEPVKFMRRYSFGRCLDIEHVQMEAAGFFEEAFISVMREASHIHLTGYTFGSEQWHTHIHHAPEHNRHVLDLLAGVGYRGMVVSEARLSLQTLEEFKALNAFAQDWKRS